ncbi:hypothetical protein BSLG_006018 [Batrachochytrium salamandrivorans]|nr:hypothetical protein BSLG_006018 [Batrachochytrium salamandrivorans]
MDLQREHIPAASAYSTRVNRNNATPHSTLKHRHSFTIPASVELRRMDSRHQSSANIPASITELVLWLIFHTIIRTFLNHLKHLLLNPCSIHPSSHQLRPSVPIDLYNDPNFDIFDASMATPNSFSHNTTTNTAATWFSVRLLISSAQLAYGTGTGRIPQQTSLFIQEGEPSYGALARTAMGRQGAMWADIAISACCYGFAVSYLVSIADSMPKAAAVLFPEFIVGSWLYHLFQIPQFWMFAFLVLIAPLCYAKSIFSVYNEVGATYRGESVAPETVRHIRRVVDLSIIAVAILYLAVGICGFLAFGNSSMVLILDNFPDTPFITFARLMYALLAALSVRFKSLHSAMQQEHSRSYILTTSILVFTYLMSLWFNTLEDVLSFVGGTGGVIMCFVMPALFYWNLTTPETGGWRRPFSVMLAATGSICGILNIECLLSIVEGTIQPFRNLLLGQFTSIFSEYASVISPNESHAKSKFALSLNELLMYAFVLALAAWLVSAAQSLYSNLLLRCKFNYLWVIRNLVVFIFGSYLALHSSVKLSLAILAVFPVVGAVLGYMHHTSSVFDKKLRESYRYAGLVAHEVFISIKTVMAFNRQFYESVRYTSHLAEALSFYVGGKLVAANEITPGDVLNSFSQIAVGITALGNIGQASRVSIRIFSFTCTFNPACQNSDLFDGSIHYNVSLGIHGNADQVSRSVVQNACNISQASTFINELPDGYDTDISGLHTSLSGGQIQRLAIARAYLGAESGMLILDEATSALDTSTERLVMNSLIESRKNKTILCVSHRVASLTEFTRIIVFKEGHVAEDGSFEKLTESQTIFKTLLETRQTSAYSTTAAIPLVNTPTADNMNGLLRKRSSASAEIQPKWTTVLKSLFVKINQCQRWSKSNEI